MQTKKLRELKPMEVGKTANTLKGNEYTYIMLSKRDNDYTVFTTENDGMIMNCSTKEIEVNVVMKPISRMKMCLPIIMVIRNLKD